MPRFCVSAACALLLCFWPHAGVCARQPCEPVWSDQLGNGAMNDKVSVLLPVEWNGRRELIAGGRFTRAGNTEAARVARWDGEEWHALGLGLGIANAEVRALAMFDDGTGSSLYAGGNFNYSGTSVATAAFVPGIARWDGAAWQPVGGGLTGTVIALEVFDDGSGPALYAGGGFRLPGASENVGLARWDGAAWAEVGEGLSRASNIFALEVFDDLTGPKLYAGGNLPKVNGEANVNLAAWDGQNWSVVGGGVSGIVKALKAADLGGPRLLVSGLFAASGGLAAHALRIWDGMQWTVLGNWWDGEVGAIEVFDAGEGPRIHMAPSWQGYPVYQWDGGLWNQVSEGLIGTVHAFAVHDDGQGPSLMAGGSYSSLCESNGIARMRTGSRWGPLKWEVGLAPRGIGGVGVFNMRALEDGGESSLFVTGEFLSVGGQYSPNAGKFTRHGWEAMGLTNVDSVMDVAIFDSGAGPEVYICGILRSLTSQSQEYRVAKQTATGWELLPLPGSSRLVVFDVGDGPALYGVMMSAGGRGLVRWDGTGWVNVAAHAGGDVHKVKVVDLGEGPRLCMAGGFTSVDGHAAGGVALWDGKAWDVLGGGTNGIIYAIDVFDEGDGPRLVIGGNFTTAGGGAIRCIASHGDGGWRAIGPTVYDTVYAMAVFDDGGGPAIYADRSIAGAVKWRGGAWHPVAGAPACLVRDMVVFDDGSGPALWWGGDFSHAGGVESSRLAKLSACGGGCYVNCDGSAAMPHLNILDFVCFQQRFAAGDPWANCDGSTAAQVLNAADFVCFQLRFAAGCP